VEATRKLRPEKQAVYDEIRAHLRGASHAVMVGYQGMKVSQMEGLRRRLAKNQTRLQVVKKTLLARAVGEAGWQPLDPAALEGPTALIWGAGDVAETVKTLEAYVREAKAPAVRGAYLGGRFLGVAEVEELGRLPSRTVLYGMLAGALAGPMSGVVGVLSRTLSGLVQVLKAVQDKKEKGEPAQG
jgi:large subunit ribosomal protein L10